MSEVTLTPLAPAPKPVVAETPPAPAPVVKEEPKPKPVVASSERFKGRSPCEWNIQPTADGIFALNGSTGESFEGTIAEFNARLNG